MRSDLFNKFTHYVQSLSAIPLEKQRYGLPAITISRETGAGAVSIGKLLIDLLTRENRGPAEPPWTLLDQNLAEKVVEDHLLPPRLVQYMEEDAKFPLTDAVEQILGLHPASWSLVQYTTQSILRLAAIGHVIVVGRGSSFITAKLANVLHVRLVAPFSKRVQYMAEDRKLTAKEAADYVHRTDQARKRYVRNYFNAGVDDPLAYHLTINTGAVSYAHSAEIIAEALAHHVHGGRARNEQEAVA